MSIPTVAVTCRAYDQQGNPVAGGTFRFKLDRTEIYNGFVAPELYEATANDQGVAVVNVFPNALGTASSQYRVQAFNADTGSKYLDVMAVVPNSACDLEDIVQLPPYPSVDQSQQALQAVQAAAAGVTADANAAAASATAAQTSATNAATSATNAANSATTATNAANSIGNAVSQAQAAATTATTQAGIATTKAGEASTSATNAASSASSATGSAATATTKATEAANSASSASTSATNAASSATTAQNAVASIGNSVTQAQTAATTATNSATTATTKASEATASASAAATSASNAAASAGQAATSATNAAGSASTASSAATTATNASNNALSYANTATTQAQSATASATSAATSATNASNSATSAAQAQSAAETARDQTLAAFDNFDDRYLGAKSSDPTVDNDGNPLVSGALYFNTNPLNSGGGMKVYDGSVWLAAYASLSGALLSANNLSDLASASAARTNLGLGNVENKSSATIRGEITSGNVTTALGFTPYNATNPAGYITSSALTPYLLSADAASTYQTQAGMSAYLTTASAASTYQTQAGMSAYLTTADASTTYLTQANASSTYLTQANAASTYQTQSGMSSYLTTASASSTYLTQANAASTYQTQSGMSAYQPTLVSGTNIKSVNGSSLLGSGDLTIQGGINFTRRTANYTAIDKDGILADTTGGAFTVTLPATPSSGTQVWIADGGNFATNNLTVARNGSTIEGLAEDMALDITGALVQLIYDGTTWQVFAEVGYFGGSAVDTTTAQTLSNKTLASPTLTGTLAFSGTGNRITGDFSNATFSNRMLFQTSTVNGNTQIGLIPNGTAVNTAFFAYNNPNPTNASTAALRVNASEAALISGITGTGTYLPLVFLTGNSERARIDTSGLFGIGMTPAASQGQLQVFGVGVTGGAPASSGTTDANQIAEFGAGSVQLSFGAYANGDAWIQQRSTASFAVNYGMGLNPNGGRIFLGGGLQEARSAMGASDINLSLANYFTRTISGATTLTVSNVPAAGTAASFILDLTNGGSATITWWSGVKWAGGTAPTLTSSGRDVLGFFTHDGGTTWTGLVLGKDVK